VEVESSVNTWGHGLAVRLTTPLVEAAGLKSGSPIKIKAQPGLITIHSQPDRRSIVLSMQRALAHAMKQDMDAVLEMAITRMHMQMFPREYDDTDIGNPELGTADEDVTTNQDLLLTGEQLKAKYDLPAETQVATIADFINSALDGQPSAKPTSSEPMAKPALARKKAPLKI